MLEKQKEIKKKRQLKANSHKISPDKFAEMNDSETLEVVGGRAPDFFDVE